MVEERDKPEDRDRQEDVLLKTPPNASHLHYAYRSFSFRDIKVS